MNLFEINLRKKRRKMGQIGIESIESEREKQKPFMR